MHAKLFKDIFKSKNNESLSFVNWALGQPNNFGNNQNYVSISYPNFKWGDWSGDTIGEVICQQEIKGENRRTLSPLFYPYNLSARTPENAYVENV